MKIEDLMWEQSQVRNVTVYHWLYLLIFSLFAQWLLMVATMRQAHSVEVDELREVRLTASDSLEISPPR